MKITTVKHQQQNKIKTYSASQIIPIILNYAIGTGVLSLHQAFAKSSVITSIIFSSIISFVAYIMGQCTLDLITRTYALENKGVFDGKKQKIHKKQQVSIDQQDLMHSHELPQKSKLDVSIPNSKSYQMSVISKLYFGNFGFVIYQLAQCSYFFGSVWGYTSVVSQSLASLIPFTYLFDNGDKKWTCMDPCGTYQPYCSQSYWIWTGITAIMGSILIFFNLAQQQLLQSILTCARFVMLITTFIIIIYCLFTQPFIESQYDQKQSFYVNKNVKYFDFDIHQIGALFAAVAFSQVYHHSLPNIFQYVQIKQQKKLKLMLFCSFLLLLSITLMIAVPGAFYFGSNGTDLVLLNFENWTGKQFINNEAQNIEINLIARSLSYILRIIPPIYLMSSIPNNAMTMALNILELFPLKQRKNKYIIYFIKLLSLLPPVLLAGKFRCLGKIIQFTGLAGFLILAMPGVIQLRAKYLSQRYLKVKYNDIFSSKLLNNTVVVVLCELFIVFGVIVTILNLAKNK